VVNKCFPHRTITGASNFGGGLTGNGRAGLPHRPGCPIKTSRLKSAFEKTPPVKGGVSEVLGLRRKLRRYTGRYLNPPISQDEDSAKS
jgi:hypothetical protein